MKKITHIFAVIASGVMIFVATPAGQAVIHQYPVISAVLGAIGALTAVYHSPKA